MTWRAIAPLSPAAGSCQMSMLTSRPPTGVSDAAALPLATAVAPGADGRYRWKNQAEVGETVPDTCGPAV